MAYLKHYSTICTQTLKSQNKFVDWNRTECVCVCVCVYLYIYIYNILCNLTDSTKTVCIYSSSDKVSN